MGARLGYPIYLISHSASVMALNKKKGEKIMFVRTVRFLMLLTVVLALAACGGGGGGKTAGDQPAKVAGAIEFPAETATKQTAKQVNASVTVLDVLIKVYSVETGQEVPGLNIIVQRDDSNPNQNLYSYSASGIVPNKNYLFKAIRRGQIVRRYIPSTDVTSGADVTGQTVDPVSTATVIIVQSKLNLPAGTMLGESPLPPTVTTVKVNDINPKLLESTIRTEILAGKTSSNITLVNAVTNSISSNTDPVAAPTAAITTSATSAATNYLPPPTTADAAKVYVAQASAALAKQDVAAASIAYENALVADPANKDANFGGALTKIVMLIDDPKIKDIFLKWGVISPSANQVLSHSSPIGNPFQNWTSAFQQVPSTGLPKNSAKSTAAGQDAARSVISSFSMMRSTLPKFVPTGAASKSTAKTTASSTIPATAPTVSDMQVTITGTVIPALNEALARLKKVEGAGYTYKMTKEMQGNPVSGVDITMNDGEIYALETAINAFLCALNVGASYNLDVYDYDANGTRNDYNKLSQDPLKTINQSTFFTLKTTGATSMQAGLTALQDSVANLEKAYNVLKTRTAAQTASGQGAFDLANMTAQDKIDFEKFLGYAKKAVAGQTDILYNNDTKSIAVNITKLFTNPLTRNNAPTLGYDVQPDAVLSAKYNKPVAGEQTNYGWTYPIESEIVPTADIPDYTLNGILPTNTIANNVAGFNGILPVVSGKLLSGATDSDLYNFTTDGTFVYYINYGSPYQIKKIDPSTGVVSVLASGNPTGNASLQRLLWYNGNLHAVSIPYNYSSYSYSIELAPVTVTNGTYAVGSVVKSIPLSSNQWPSAVASVGTDIYYALESWNQLTYTNTSEIRKISNLTTDVSLFTVSDYISSLNVSGNYLYAGEEKRSLNSPYSVVATYANAHSDILVGGYFYSIDNGKIIKKAGTPTGGSAKLVSSMF